MLVHDKVLYILRLHENLVFLFSFLLVFILNFDFNLLELNFEAIISYRWNYFYYYYFEDLKIMVNYQSL